MWEDWAERLDDSNIPDEAARHFARNGSLEERWYLTSNEGLSEAVMRILMEDQDDVISQSMAVNLGMTADLLDDLARLHPEFETLVNQNRNASVARKSDWPLELLINKSIENFFRDVGATADEQDRFYEVIGYTAPRITVGEAWARVRPSVSD